MYCGIAKENPKIEEHKLQTSRRTKTWLRTQIGSISFSTEHRLVNLCIAASSLFLYIHN
jgi:hypothetical protein